MTSGELVSHWLAGALSDERGFSVLNRPQVAQHVALNGDAVPNAQALPKEEVTASLTLNQVNAIDEKAQNFEGDGELVLGWKDERLCFPLRLASLAMGSDRGLPNRRNHAQTLRARASSLAAHDDCHSHALEGVSHHAFVD